MRVRRIIAPFVVVISAALHVPARAQPATAPSGAAEGRVAALAQRFRDALDQLDLSEAQKADAARIADELRAGVRKAVADARGDVEQLRMKVRELVNDARLDLQDVLSTEQQEKLRDLLEQAAPRRRPAMRDEPMAPPDQPAPVEQPVPKDDAPATAPAAAVTPQIGEVAPDFTLDKLDGRQVQLSSMRGKPVVLLFGNYSSPTFRDLVDDYERLRKKHGNRAEFLIVYTRESHPVGGWEVERNKHARVLVEQPATFDERKALARQAKQALKLTIPIAVDTMEDATASSYGARTTCAFVIGREGTVVGFRKHGDVHAIARTLEDVVASRSASTSRPSSNPS